jgi:hypothetical protein
LSVVIPNIEFATKDCTMKKIIMALAATGMVATGAIVPTTPAFAKRTYYTSENGVRYWQGSDGRYYCRRSNGTTGLIIGAAGGALIGRAIDSHGSRATGTILGAAIGAVAGRAVERSRKVRCN